MLKKSGEEFQREKVAVPKVFSVSLNPTYMLVHTHTHIHTNTVTHSTQAYTLTGIYTSKVSVH